MKPVSQTIRISISLVMLTLFVILMANWLGYVPDETKARIRERVIITESLAVMCTTAIKSDNIEILHEAIKQYANLHTEIQSALLVKKDGSIIAKHGNHTYQPDSTTSTPDLIKVPLYRNNEHWGTVEISFTSFRSGYLWGVIESSFFRLMAFIALFGFILYVLLIRRILSHLDPFKVVPARVKKAFDALSEAVVIINSDERIVLANKVFENKFNFNIETMLGKKLSSLPWLLPEKNGEATTTPWSKALLDGSEHTNVKLDYKTSANSTLSIIVNCTPLTDEKGSSKGALASFNDVTDLEKMNKDLENMSKFLRHEIYNELVGASGSVRLLEGSENISEKDKELLKLTRSSHDVIQNLLNSMREANSIESSFANEEIKQLRLDMLVKEVSNNYSNVYGNNEFIFKSDGKEITIRGQEERIIQMIGKLASNAVDYAESGTPILISCTKNNNNAVIKILNQG